jgi:hypothetical protein
VKRLQLFEFEDQPWFPSWLRTCMTNVIVVFCRVVGVVPALSGVVTRALREQGLDRIIDLGSGGGGSMPEVLVAVRSEPGLAGTQLLMTDLYPNTDAVATFNDPANPECAYQAEPVDATNLAAAPAGLKTMVNCFHHMRPAQARSILASAVAEREPLLIYEMGESPMPTSLWVLSLPLALPMVFVTALVWTPFVRPLTLRQLFFTYVVPLVPLFYAWDGHASLPRVYGHADLNILLEGLDTPGYQWEHGSAEGADGKAFGFYLFGRPTPVASKS